MHDDLIASMDGGGGSVGAVWAEKESYWGWINKVICYRGR